LDSDPSGGTRFYRLSDSIGIASTKLAFLVLLLMFPLSIAGCLDPCNDCVTAQAGGPGTFSATGPLDEERAFSSAAILPGDASVLVVGGGRLPGYLTRSQIYDPAAAPSASATPMFVSDAELKSARANHTSTLLKDGHVLVCGGDNGLEALNSCEIYTPAPSSTGAFEDAASMFATRTHHTATLLKDGRVFIAGGSPSVATTANGDIVPHGALDTAEFFEPATGNFVGVFDAMTTPRSEHTATLLDDGTILLVGGVDENGTALASAEIFDPHAQTFTPTVGTLEVARFDHTATLMHCGNGCGFDGEVLITGGFNNASQSISVAEIYKPSDKSFHQLASTLMTPRALHTASELDNVGVLIAGGVNNDPSNNFINLNTAEIFDFSSEEFVMLTSTMSDAPSGRSGAAAAQVSINGSPQILITFGGGADFNGAFFSSLPSSAQFDPVSETFSVGPASPPLTACSNTTLNPFGCAVTRAAHTATTLDDGRLLIVGGYEATAVRLPTAEIYTVKDKGFVPTTHDMNEARVFQTSTVIAMGANNAGDIVIAGGEPLCDGTAERYHVSDGTFIPIGPMTSSNRCSFFTATPLSDGRILYTGGFDINFNALNTAELYNPATDSFTAVGNMSTARWGHAAIQLNDGTGDVLIVGGNTCSGSMECSGFVTSAELFVPTPTGGSFTHISTPLNDDRFFASVSNLPANATAVTPNGVLIAGGSGDNTAEIYAPTNRTFQPASSPMSFIRFFQTATTINFSDMSQLILITGGSGRNAFNDLIPISSAEIFDPNRGVFCGTGNMTTPRAFHSATQLNPNSADVEVLVAGGYGGNASLGTAELYNPDSKGCSATENAPQVKSIAGLSEHLRTRIMENLRAMSQIGY
jgi:hypothetical protein